MPRPSGELAYEALGDGLSFRTMPFAEETEITGPLAAKLFVSSTTSDADLFLIVQLFDPGGNEVTFEGSTDPNTPIANGWLRASHRALDPGRSKPWQPFHPHDRMEPLEPGEIYELDVEIVPTCIVVPPGYRLGLWVRGKDYEYRGPLDEYGQSFYYATRGTGGMTHADPDDRPPTVFGGTVTVHVGPEHPSHLLSADHPRKRPIEEGSQIMTTTADFVVAGGGHNSLITAAYLARAGHEVVVLDARSEVGGGAATEEILTPGLPLRHVLDRSHPDPGQPVARPRTSLAWCPSSASPTWSRIRWPTSSSPTGRASPCGSTSSGRWRRSADSPVRTRSPIDGCSTSSTR